MADNENQRLATRISGAKYVADQPRPDTYSLSGRKNAHRPELE
jgi:hypothetical protein